jgi:hypothetical protein
LPPSQAAVSSGFHSVMRWLRPITSLALTFRGGVTRKHEPERNVCAAVCFDAHIIDKRPSTQYGRYPLKVESQLSGRSLADVFL